MRQLIYAFLLLILLPVLSHAQVEGVLHKRFGLRVGANISTLSSAPTGDNISSKGGIYAAMYHQFRIRHNIGLSWELGFSMLGCKNNYYSGYFDTAGSSATTTLNLSYLTMPVSFKLYLSKAFTLQLGPYGSLLLSAVEKGTIYPPNGYNLQSYRQQLNSTLSTWDTGIQGGIGIEGRSGINFTLKYYASVMGVYPSLQQVSGIVMRNQFFQFTMGYSFKGR